MLYLRVSTKRQLRGEVSIPSQRKAGTAHCETIGKPVLGEFIDGATGTDDARPSFRSMVEQAKQPGCRFDTIVVYSLSRFYRSGPEMELLIRALRKKGVQVVSVTQPIGNDPVHTMLRQFIGICDEYTSTENGKNTRRSMRENGEQGFWNGTTPPLGYRTVDAERRGIKIKKKLEVDPVEADIVTKIFNLYLNGLPGQGPLGVKGVVNVVNAQGLRTRKGARFGVGPLHNILTSRYYADGEYRWGEWDQDTGEANEPGKFATILIPPLVSRDTFDRVQEKLRASNPRTTPPRNVNGPSLLAGLAVCGGCGAGMTRTGTVRRERRYSYYTCAGCHQKGRTECRGRHVPVEKLDALVLGALKERLFAPARLDLLLRALIDQQAQRAAEASGRLVTLQAAAEDARSRLARLYRAIEDGVADEDEILRERIAALRAEQDKAQAALDRAKLQLVPAAAVDAERVARFGRLMCERMDEGEVGARRAYIAAVVSRIEVHDDVVRIVGERETLKTAVLGNSGQEHVSGFVRRWRAPQDSNLRPSGSKPDTLSS